MSNVKEVAEFALVVRDALGRIEARLDKLENKLAIAYRGVWTPDEEYAAGEYATYQGSLWCAIRDTRPGDVPGKAASFRLAAKGG